MMRRAVIGVAVVVALVAQLLATTSLGATAAGSAAPPPLSCTPAPTDPAHVVTGAVGSLNLTGGAWEVTAATVSGSITVASNTSVVILNSTVSGSLMGGSGSAVSVCGSQLGGGASVSNPLGLTLCSSSFGGALIESGSTDEVLIGDPAVSFCGANQLTSKGASLIMSNAGGADVTGNTFLGSMLVSGDTNPTAVAGNAIGGSLTCQNNTPPPTDDGIPNTVTGATVGQCASGVRPAGVSGLLSTALLALSPTVAGPEVVGGTQALTATLTSKGKPIAGQQIAFAVTGSNPGSASATTNTSGVATFTYAGARPGLDHVQASTTSGGSTIYSSPASVSWVSLASATLTLSPASVLNAVAGTTQVMTATLSAAGQPIAGQPVAFIVTGANATTGSATTSATGAAVFTYPGANTGADTVVATATGGGSTATSSPAHITWVAANTAVPGQVGVSTTPVLGDFFAEPATARSFVATPTDTPAFGQTFPDVEFDPPAGTVNGEPASGPKPGTRPFTDVTTDEGGGFSGTIVAQGNGEQAGTATTAGNLKTFDSVLTANLHVAHAGTLTFQVVADDAFLFGVGGGATKASGTVTGTTTTTTPFHGYPLDGAYDQPGTGQPGLYSIAVSFPAAGVYPYELDYASCCDQSLTLTLNVVVSSGTSAQPYSLFVGYADTTRPGTGHGFPNPWLGAPNTTFVGGGSPFDTGGLRFDNPASTPLSLDSVTVDIGTHHFAPWAAHQTVPANGSLILAGSTGTAGGGPPSNGAAGGGTGQNGFATSAFATGFPSQSSGQTGIGNVGPLGEAFSPSGQLYVGDLADSNLYRFDTTGGDATAHRLTNVPAGSLVLTGLAFSKSGRLYAAENGNSIHELDPNTGASLRTVFIFPFGFTDTTDIAFDPLSGDLFASDGHGFNSLYRITHIEDGGTPALITYGPGGIDGMVIGPDGTIYGAQSGGGNRESILAIAGTDKPQPAAVTVLANDIPTPDGIALIAPPAGQPVTKVVVNRNDGIITQLDLTTNPATETSIVTGGTRGDFVTTGPDGCLYATQSTMIEKVTASDGSCPFIPPAGTPGTFDTSEAIAAGSGTAAIPVPHLIATPFATGFPTKVDNNSVPNPVLGPLGVAFDSSGRLMVGDVADGNIYRFGPAGGTAAANKLSAAPIPALTGAMAFSKSGRLYASSGPSGLIEVDPNNGSVLRVINAGGADAGLATDPLTGDLFYSDGCCEALTRVTGLDTGPGSDSVYAPAPAGVDGMVFGPDGTMFASVYRAGTVIEVPGTNKSPSSTFTTLATFPNGSHPEGVALVNPPPGQPVTQLVVSRNDGVISDVDFSTNPPTVSDVLLGGTRGAYTAVGPDGCLYATQSDSVEKITAPDGSCPFIPVTANAGTTGSVQPPAVPHFTATPFATGFPTSNPNGGAGPIGLVFNKTGQLFVGDLQDGNLYRFGPSGGTAAANQVTPSRAGDLSGLTFSKSGRLYAGLAAEGKIAELDPTTGAVLRTFAVTNGTVQDLQADPISGDLFFSSAGLFSGPLSRVSHFEDGGPIHVASYGPANIDGFTFGPDGTIFGAQQGGPNNVLKIAGTDQPQPAAVTTVWSTTKPIDGIALLNPGPGQPVTQLVVNRNDGVITQVGFETTPPTTTDIFSGGTRGDFVTTGPDGCLYATQSASVLKLSYADGTCPFIPPPGACLGSATVPQIHVAVNGTTTTYADPSLELTAGGHDGDGCGTNESEPWAQLAGATAAVGVPLPPAVSLLLSPAVTTDVLVGSTQVLHVAATDEAGHPAVGVPVTLAVGGANPQTLNATTDATGAASFSYVGHAGGSDAATASTVVAGVAAFSNQASVTWSIPVPGGPGGASSGPAPPVVTVTSPADGTTVTAPTPIVALVNPPATSPIASFLVTDQAVGSGSSVTLASGSGAPPSTVATFDPTGLAAGTYAVLVAATTAAGSSAAAVVHLIVPGPAGTGGGGTPAQAPPSITNISPVAGSTITQPTPVTATITAPSGETISSWSVGYQRASSPTVVSLGSGSGPPPATLATFDPTVLPDDTYAIVITATASGGGSATATDSVAVTASFKPGRYVTTFKDLSIPVAGFSADVARVYDSYDKTVGDFGVGWHLGASDYKVSVNTPLGAGGWSAQPNSCTLFGCTYAFVSSAPHYATVTFPDGHQEVFDFTPAGGFGPFFYQGSSAFTARKGTQTTSTLAVDPASDPGVTFGFDGSLYAGLGTAVYSPTRFLLTLSNGDKLLLDQSTGLVSETDPHGNVVAFDSAGIHATNASGTAEPGIAFTRDGQGRITQVTGPSGQNLTYAYSSVGDLVSVTDPVGNTTTFTYDANHDLTKITGPGGPTQTEHYDNSGRLVSITDADGNTTAVTNNVGGLQQVITDPLGQLTSVLTFDAAGDLLSQQDTAGGISRTTSHTYDTLGDATSTVDPLGDTTFATFDAQGNQTSSTDALGNQSTATFGPMNEVLSRTDPLGRTTSGSYDAAGNLTTLTEPTGATIQLSYDANGAPATLTDELGHAYNFTNNASGKPVAITDPLSHVLSFGYDASGNQTSVVDPLNAGSAHSYSNGYDAANRPTSTTDPLGDVTRTGYDPLGDIASTTTANGNATTYSYDPAQQQTQITDPNGGAVKFTYDADGRQTSITDPDSHVRTTTYDAFGDVLSKFDPATGTTTYQADAAGRVTSSTDARGVTTTSAYDADRRLTSQITPDGTVTRAYDAAGQLTSVTDPTGTTSYTYDPDGRITSVASPEGTLGYTYDADGHRLTMTLPGPKTVTYSYDADENLTGEAGLGQTLGLSYNPDNQLTTLTRPNGVTTRYTYDSAARTSSVVSANGASALVGFTYTRDADGNPLTATTGSGTTTYAYDKLDRLLSSTGGAPTSQTFTYDPAGNITSVASGGTTSAYSYGSGGNLTQVGTQPVRSDPAGDITQIGATTYAWNGRGQLKSITAGASASTNTYDGNNLRVATTGPATTDLWDQVDPTTGELTAIPLLLSDGTNTFLAADGHTLGQVAGTIATYYLPDALGSVVGTTGQAGTLASSTTYSSYGQVASQTGPTVPFGFTGQSQDPTGLVFLRARYLPPALGQFLTPDTIQPNASGTQGYNLSSYAADSPLSAIDPSGREPEWLAAVKAAAKNAYIQLGYFGTALLALINEFYGHAQEISEAAKALEERGFGNDVQGVLSQYAGNLGTLLLGIARLISTCFNFGCPPPE